MSVILFILLGFISSCLICAFIKYKNTRKSLEFYKKSYAKSEHQSSEILSTIVEVKHEIPIKYYISENSFDRSFIIWMTKLTNEGMTEILVKKIYYEDDRSNIHSKVKNLVNELSKDMDN